MVNPRDVGPVFLIPGLMGSWLRDASRLFLDHLWKSADPETITAVLSGLLALQPDGITPLKSSVGRIEAYELDLPSYGPMIENLGARGFEMYRAPYDWRKDLLLQGQDLWRRAKAIAGRRRINIVAHSQGGLAARWMYRAMISDGAEAQLRRIITLDSPHQGSYDAVALLAGVADEYKAIISRVNQGVGLVQMLGGLTLGVGADVVRSRGQRYLDQSLATWPGLIQLMPNPNVGLERVARPRSLPRSTLYQVSSWQLVNQYVTQAILNDAAVAWAELSNPANEPPGNIFYQFVGTGHPTVNYVKADNFDRLALGTRGGYQINTSLGDRRIMQDDQQTRGAIPIPHTADHYGMLFPPEHFATIASILQTEDAPIPPPVTPIEITPRLPPPPDVVHQRPPLTVPESTPADFPSYCQPPVLTF